MWRPPGFHPPHFPSGFHPPHFPSGFHPPHFPPGLHPPVFFGPPGFVPPWPHSSWQEPPNRYNSSDWYGGPPYGHHPSFDYSQSHELPRVVGVPQDDEGPPGEDVPPGCEGHSSYMLDNSWRGSLSTGIPLVNPHVPPWVQGNLSDMRSSQQGYLIPYDGGVAKRNVVELSEQRSKRRWEKDRNFEKEQKDGDKELSVESGECGGDEKKKENMVGALAGSSATLNPETMNKMEEKERLFLNGGNPNTGPAVSDHSYDGKSDEGTRKSLTRSNKSLSPYYHRQKTESSRPRTYHRRQRHRSCSRSRSRSRSRRDKDRKRDRERGRGTSQERQLFDDRDKYATARARRRQKKRGSASSSDESEGRRNRRGRYHHSDDGHGDGAKSCRHIPNERRESSVALQKHCVQSSSHQKDKDAAEDIYLDKSVRAEPYRLRTAEQKEAPCLSSVKLISSNGRSQNDNKSATTLQGSQFVLPENECEALRGEEIPMKIVAVKKEPVEQADSLCSENQEAPVAENRSFPDASKILDIARQSPYQISTFIHSKTLNNLGSAETQEDMSDLEVEEEHAEMETEQQDMEDLERIRSWNLEAVGDFAQHQKLVQMALPIVEKTRELLSTEVFTPCDGEEATNMEIEGRFKEKPRQGLEGPYTCIAEVERQLRARKPAVAAVGSSGTGKTKLVNTLLKQSLPSEAVYTRYVLQEDEETELMEVEVVAPGLHDPHTEQQLSAHDLSWLHQLKRFDRVKVFYPCDVQWYEVVIDSTKPGPGDFITALVFDVLNSNTLEIGDTSQEFVLGDGTGGSILTQRSYPIPFLKQDEERAQEDLGDYFLLKEGCVLDSTMVPTICSYGPRLCVRQYFETESTVFNLLERPLAPLKRLLIRELFGDFDEEISTLPCQSESFWLSKAVVKAWKEAGKQIETDKDTTGGGPTEDGVSPQLWKSVKCEEDNGEEGNEDKAETGGIRPAWLQTALAMIGRDSKTPLTDISLHDIALPPRFKGLLGKVRLFTPRCNSATQSALTEHVEKVKQFLLHETRFEIEDDCLYGEPRWRLTRKVVLEIPSAVLQQHDIIDTQGITSRANAFVQQDLTRAQYVLAVMDGRADNEKVWDKLRAEFLEPLTAYALQEETTPHTAVLAVVVHGEKGFPSTSSGSTQCLALASGDPVKTRKLRAAEQRIMNHYRSSLETSISHMLSCRGQSKHKANLLAAKAVKSSVSFFYLYTQLLYEPEKFHCKGISEENSGLPELRKFLQQGLPVMGFGATTSANTPLLLSPVQIVQQVADILKELKKKAEDTFELMRLKDSPGALECSKLEEAIRSIGRKGKFSWSRFRQKEWACRLLESVEKDIKEVADERASQCTAEEFGVQLVRLCVDPRDGADLQKEEKQIGIIPPYLFNGHLKKLLGEPVRLLHLHGEYKNVKLYEVMAAPHFEWTLMPFPGDLSLKCFMDEEAIKIASEEEVGPLYELYSKVLKIYDDPLKDLENSSVSTNTQLRIILQSMRSELRMDLLSFMRKSLGALEPLEYFSIISNKLRDTADDWICGELLTMVAKSHGAIWDTRSDRGMKITRFYATCRWCSVVGPKLADKYVEVATKDIGDKVTHLCRVVNEKVKHHCQQCENFSIKQAFSLLGGSKLHRCLQDYHQVCILMEELEYAMNNHTHNNTVCSQVLGRGSGEKDRRTLGIGGKGTWLTDVQPWGFEEYGALLVALKSKEFCRLHPSGGNIVDLGESMAEQGYGARSHECLSMVVTHLGMAFGGEGEGGLAKAIEYFSDPENVKTSVEEEDSEALLNAFDERPGLWVTSDVARLLKAVKVVLEELGKPVCLECPLRDPTILSDISSFSNGCETVREANMKASDYVGLEARCWVGLKEPKMGVVAHYDSVTGIYRLDFKGKEMELETLTKEQLQLIVIRPKKTAPMELKSRLRCKNETKVEEYGERNFHTEEEVRWIIGKLADFYGETEESFKNALDYYDVDGLKLGPEWITQPMTTYTRYSWKDPANPKRVRIFRNRFAVREFLRKIQMEKEGIGNQRRNKKSVRDDVVSPWKRKEIALKQQAFGNRTGFVLFGGSVAISGGRIREGPGVSECQKSQPRRGARERRVKDEVEDVTESSFEEALRNSGRGKNRAKTVKTGQRRLLKREMEELLDRIGNEGWTHWKSAGGQNLFRPPGKLLNKYPDLQRQYSSFVSVRSVLEMLEKRSAGAKLRKEGTKVSNSVTVNQKDADYSPKP